MSASISPERRRALAVLTGLNVQWHISGKSWDATLAALEEVEHFRPVVEAAKAFVDAKSGVQRFNALCDIASAVTQLRKNGR